MHPGLWALVTHQLPNLSVVPVPPCCDLLPKQSRWDRREGTSCLPQLHISTKLAHEVVCTKMPEPQSCPSHGVDTGSAQSDVSGSCSSREDVGLS